MYDGGPNPTKIQTNPSYKRANPPPPLVLIHDGGGTTFGYFILGSIFRELWAIHNPHYWDGDAFEGGVDEMARLYTKYMYDAGLKGAIVLGGWSFGGYLSLAVSRLLAADPEAQINVAGIVLMDTPYHVPYSRIKEPSESAIKRMPLLVQKAFDRCDEMLATWDSPKWDGPARGGKTVSFGVGGKRYSVAPGTVLYKSLEGTYESVDAAQYHHGGETPEKPLAPPPAVLIRCARPIPLPEGRTDPFLIDKCRSDHLLGWGGNYPDFIKAVIDVDTNHYDMLTMADLGKMKYLTAQLKQALEILDSIGAL